MKKKSIVLGILAGFFLIAIIGLIFLPAILSSDFAKAQVLLQANQRLPVGIGGRATLTIWYHTTRNIKSNQFSL